MLLHDFIDLTDAPEEDVVDEAPASAGLTRLELNGVEIHSLAELRENFHFDQIVSAVADGSLVQWLEERFYDKEASEIEELVKDRSPAVDQELCRILGVDYVQYGQLTSEQREAYEKKCDIIRRHTNDVGILSHALETATNQSELAELLNAGKSTIYLCANCFTVPIRKSGVHYIGIGNPRMDAPFTEEQYRRAGITFEGVSLPATPDPEAADTAERAARCAGYDDFADRHNTLAVLFHQALKVDKLTKFCYLDHNATDVTTEFYKNRLTAKAAARRVVDDAYEKANRIFTPGGKGCLADHFAQRYADLLTKRASPILERLKDGCAAMPKLKSKLDAMEKLIADARQTFQAAFEDELREDANYYKMYEKSYFMDKVEIQAHDFNTDLFESELANGIARLLFDETEYTAEGLLEAMNELQDDMNSHAEMFCSMAHDAYRDYCQKIEEIAEEIGKELSGDDLVRMDILEKP